MLRALLGKTDFRTAVVKSVSSHMLIVNNTTLLSSTDNILWARCIIQIQHLPIVILNNLMEIYHLKVFLMKGNMSCQIRNTSSSKTMFHSCLFQRNLAWFCSGWFTPLDFSFLCPWMRTGICTSCSKYSNWQRANALWYASRNECVVVQKRSGPLKG